MHFPSAAFLFLISFLIRFFFLNTSGYHGLGGDEGMYWRLAHQAFQGKILFTYYMPGWPNILAGFMSITPTLDNIRIGVIAIASITPVLLYLLGKNIFNNRTGFLAGLLLAISPEHIFYSHYIYAEIILEFFIVLATYVTFRSFFPLRRWKQLCLGVIIFGLGLLMKHFMVVPFIALLFTLMMYKRQKISRIVFLTLIFSAPLCLYSLRIGIKGGDTFFAAYSPLHVMNGWVANRIAAGPGRKSKVAVFKNHLKLRLTSPLSFTFHRVKTGIRNLWGLHSYTINRLLSHRFYRESFSKRSAVAAIVLFNFLILLFGIVGLIFANNNDFKFYTASQIILLTLMSFLFFFVSRHRLPFMYIFILYAANFVSIIRETPPTFTKPYALRWACVVIAVIIFSATSPWLQIHKLAISPFLK